MAGTTKLMTAGGGGVSLTPASSIASDVTVNVPSQNCTLGIQGPAFSAWSSTGTAISSGVATKIVFDTEEFDTNNNFASSRFTPTVAGYYQINASLFLGAASRATECSVVLYKNGSMYKSGFDTTAYFYTVTGSWLVYLNGSTDYVEIYGNAATGSTTGTGQALQYVQGSMTRAA